MEGSAPKYFFVADVHLGLDLLNPREREGRFFAFLQSLPEETKQIYLIGDIFDFWVEYKDVVPRGFVRVLGALAALCDRGVEVFFFKGNHDYWVTDYLTKEIGLKVIDDPYLLTEIEGKRFCLGHGDVLGKREFSFRLISLLFRSKVCIALLKALHPRWIFRFARGWSFRRRSKYYGKYRFRGEDEPLYAFANALGEREKIDYYIFGHLHTPAQIEIPSGGTMYILGSWMEEDSYLNFSGMKILGRGCPNIQM